MGGAQLQLETPIQDAISRIRFAPTSHNLLISSWDSNLRLYDVKSSVLRLQASADAAALLDCCFRSETVAFSADSDGLIRMYDLHSGMCQTIGTHDDVATRVEYCDETSQVITAGLDKKIYTWDTRSEKGNRSVLESLDSAVTSMSLSGINLMVTVGSAVHTYDLRSLKTPFKLKDSNLKSTIICGSVSPCAKGFAVGSGDGRVSLDILHPSNSNNISYMFRCHPRSTERGYHSAAVNEIEFNPIIYGVLLTGDDDGYVIAWDTQTRKRLFQLPQCPNSVASLSYHHQGQLLAVASSHTYRQANESDDPPQIFVHDTGDANQR